MSDHWGMPGPGGSLGKCAVCGDCFMTEILFGTEVRPFKCGAIEQMLYAHDPKCVDVIKASLVNDEIDPEKLPHGPLRQALERVKS